MSIDFYKEFGPLGYLANYSQHGFYKNGIYYKTVEHFYQSEKFDNEEIKNKIINANTPKEASNIGRDRNNKRKDNFKKIKEEVMYEGVLEKFRQNADIRSKLIETGNSPIREMTIDEYYWGVGKDLSGENHIGKTLMKVRNTIKNEIINDILNRCKNKKIYVIGHKNPDFDSIISSLILTNILKYNNCDAIFSLRDENIIEKELINDYLNEEYSVIDNYEDKEFILVDHNNLDGINKNNVIGAIDHHIITGEIDNLIEIEYASCCLLIYDLFKEKYDFSEKEKMLIGLTVLTDTEYLTSSRYNEISKKLYNELNLNLDVKKIQQKYFKTTDFKKSIQFNLKDNYKEYTYSNVKIRRSMITSYSYEKQRYYDEYKESMESNDIDLLIWCDYEKLTTYIIYNGMELIYPNFTTSTNLVIKFLFDEKSL